MPRTHTPHALIPLQSRKLARARSLEAEDVLDHVRSQAVHEQKTAMARPDAISEGKSIDRARIAEILARCEADWMNASRELLCGRMFLVATLASRYAGLDRLVEAKNEVGFLDVSEVFSRLRHGRACWRDVLLYAIDAAIAYGAELDPCLELLPEMY